MSDTILGLAIIASIFMGYFISVALIITPFYKSKANNYLSLSLFLIASLIFIGLLDKNYIVFTFVDNIVLDLLLAPIIFSYFLVHINHPLLKRNIYKWLYGPFIISILLEISIYFSDYLLNLHKSFFELIMNVKDLSSIAFNLFLIFYGRKLILNSKNITESKRRWLLKFNFFIICVFLSFMLAFVEEYIFNSSYIFIILWLLIGFFFWWFLYNGIFRLQVIVQKEEIHEYLNSKKTLKTIEKKKISNTTSSKIVSQLYKLMEEEEIYKDPLLSRLDLAKKLDTNEGYLSKIVNQEINKSIIQFVNEYRIEAAKRLLQDAVFNKYSIEAIGMEAGFKSKSAFYSSFNNNVEMSPGAYRKLQKTS
ncbi:helix-turn-helix domain-containing protein [Polaribacter porphyrae]|uniref:HTH araC/xylS-type domain-containing protein n=1 Tax=Polaribacter porphyrae TaxID=1137780 RepID=A0A2S7WNN5_9FLAO|nr:helix-turn-helix domain-containing protein [Polaribacter porphyrae]PQJ79225.1 hypothetical protein BTO18_08595 [Polaribacter porphyrae]